MTIPADDPRLLPISLRRDLVALGYDDRWLARALRTGTLARPRRGAYVDGAAWASLTDAERYAVRARAVARQSCTEVMLSHVSALPFLGVPLWGHGLADIHLTRTDAHSGRRERGVRQHRGRLLPGDMRTVHGLSVSSPARVVLECATVSSVEATLVVANHLLHSGMLTKDALEARYDDDMERWPHSLATRIVLSLADSRIESVGESRTAYFFFRRSLPRPTPQYAVHDGARLVARLDFALPEHGIWIEFDGRTKYEEHRRPGEDLAAYLLRERRRETIVSELTGWRCLRVTWADLAAPAELERRIRALMDSVVETRRRSG